MEGHAFKDLIYRDLSLQDFSHRKLWASRFMPETLHLLPIWHMYLGSRLHLLPHVAFQAASAFGQEASRGFEEDALPEVSEGALEAKFGYILA